MIPVRVLFLLLLCSLCLRSSATAQTPSEAATSTAHLVLGSVFDPSGAAVPAAEITVTTAAGRHWTGVTDGSGQFSVDAAAPGPFTVTVLVPGFAPAVRADVHPSAPVTLTLTAAAVEAHVDVVSAGRAAATAWTATRTDTPLLQLPQSVDIVDAAVLREQAATSLSDALRNVAGVNTNLGEGRRDQFLIRGFSAATDTLLDGTRDDAPYYRDVATVERIEVLKGPSAALSGRGSSGGVINRVLKSPRPGAPIADVAASVGSLGTRRITADVGRALTGAVAFRVAAAAEDSTSFRDDFFLKRVAAAPSVLWTGASTTALAQLELLNDSRVPDRGIPSVNGRPADVRIGQAYGYPVEDFIDTGVMSGSVRIERRFNSGWLFRQVARAGSYSTSFSNTAPSATTWSGGEWRVARQQYNAEQSQENLFSQSEAVFGSHLAGMDHVMLTGVELGVQHRNLIRFNGAAGSVALFDPVLTRPVYSSIASSYNRFSGVTTALYVQDQLALGSRWKALVGVRGDRYVQALDDRRPENVDLSRTDVNWSPRAGAVFQPTRHTSLYASISRSFQPSGEGLSLAANAADLKPEVSRNIEAGAKADLAGRASATLSIFQLDRTNMKTTDPVEPTRLVLVGRQRTSGVELSFEGAITRRLRAQAGYALLDAAVLRSNAVLSGVPIEGNRPGLVPHHGANLWMHWAATGRLALAGGFTTSGQRYTSNDNLVALPGYSRVDAAVTYRAGRVDLAINARNLFDTGYYETASSDFQIFPGTPREFVVTVRVAR